MDIVQDLYESPELWAQKYLIGSHFLSSHPTTLMQKVKNCLDFPSSVAPSNHFCLFVCVCFYTQAVFALVQTPVAAQSSMNHFFLVLNRV